MTYKGDTIHVGDVITDEHWPNKTGLVRQVDDYDSCVVIHVLWDDGKSSDFSASETTKLVYASEDFQKK